MLTDCLSSNKDAFTLYFCQLLYLGEKSSNPIPPVLNSILLLHSPITKKIVVFPISLEFR